MQNLLSVLAVAIAVGSAVFVAIQTRILARQTTVLQRTTELSYNLELIAHMNEIILRIADKRKSRAYVWGAHRRRHGLASHEGRAFLDVLDAAVSGESRLSRLQDSEFENWTIYTEYVLESSRSLRDEVHEHPDWWPNLSPIVEHSALTRGTTVRNRSSVR